MSTSAPARPALATTAPATTAPAPSAPGTARPALDWRIRFAVLSVVWGFSFLFVKVGTEAYAPLHVSLGRVFFGALTLVTVLLVRREPLPRGLRTWAHLSVAALLLNSVPFSLFAYAELTIPSSLAGICNATSPCGAWRSPWSPCPRTGRPAAASRASASVSSGC